MRIAALTISLLCLTPVTASAEVYCVSTPSQLRNALADAAASPEASDIRVRSGFYSLPAANATSVSLQYTGQSDLDLSGGWINAECTGRIFNPEETVLSASGTGRLLSIYLFSGSQTTINLLNLSFRQGDIGAGVNGAACVDIESDVAADGIVRVDRSSFRLCSKGGGSGAALRVVARSMDVYVRNNVFADNASVSGIVQFLGLGSSAFYVSNNTVANNPQIGVGGGPGGVQISAQPSDLVWFSNNVLWNNGTGNGYDLLVNSGTPIVLNSNLVGEMAPLPGGSVNNGTLAQDPRFTGAADFRPRADSPLRNGGVNPTGGALAVDILGQSRVQGGRIDRGAHEFPEFFSNGFE